jgi:hypothetical protein
MTEISGEIKIENPEPYYRVHVCVVNSLAIYMGDLTRACMVWHVAHNTGMCPVRFDEMKGPFTELGKKCKAASVTECCDAFKEIACPHNTLLNDLNNGCGDDMFYFIHTYGRLPPGTIFKKCVEGPYGMKC